MAFKFNAEVRQAQGKGASRRLRHNGQILQSFMVAVKHLFQSS